MSKPVSHSGFTLMELIVVLVIISILLVFTIPEFTQKIFRDDKEITLNWIVLNVSQLKKQARNQGKNLFMCVNPDKNTISIRETQKSADSDDNNTLAEFLLPDNVTLEGVEFNMPGQKALADTCIQFYKKGYSDHAIIHISDNEGASFSCLIQPFLHRVKVYEDYIQFQ